MTLVPGRRSHASGDANGGDGFFGRASGAALAAVVVLSIVLRMALVLAAPELPAVSDGSHFDRIARSLLDGRGFGEIPGFRTAHRAPLQPFWLAAAYGVGGASARTGALAAAFLGGLVTLATGLLAWGLAGPRAGLLAAVAAALYPRFLDYSVRLWSLSETLFIALFTAALAAWVAAERGSRRAAALAGVGFGLAALARPVALLFPLVLVLRSGSGRFPRVVLALVAAAAMVLPWTVRNWFVYDRFVPVSTMAGIVFYQGFHPPAEGWGFTPWKEIHAIAGDLPSEPDVSDRLVRQTLADIAAQPGAAARLLPWKLASLANPFSERDGTLDVTFLLAVVLGVAGVRCVRDAEAALWSIGYVAFFTLVFYGSPRFRLPVEPVLVALAAAAAVTALASARGRRLLAAVVVVFAALAAVPGLDKERFRNALGARLGHPPHGVAPEQAPSAD